MHVLAVTNYRVCYRSQRRYIDNSNRHEHGAPPTHKTRHGRSRSRSPLALRLRPVVLSPALIVPHRATPPVRSMRSHVRNTWHNHGLRGFGAALNPGRNLAGRCYGHFRFHQPKYDDIADCSVARTSSGFSVSTPSCCVPEVREQSLLSFWKMESAVAVAAPHPTHKTRLFRYRSMMSAWPFASYAESVVNSLQRRVTLEDARTEFWASCRQWGVTPFLSSFRVGGDSPVTQESGPGRWICASRFGRHHGLRAERTCRSSCQTRPKLVRPIQGLPEMQTPATAPDSEFTKYRRWK